MKPLLVHLDLNELVELNTVVEGVKERRSPLVEKEDERTGRIWSGKAFNRDPKRPRRILRIVQDLFSAVGSGLEIQLGRGPADRFLKAQFAWTNTKYKTAHSLQRDFAGTSAQGETRSRLQKFALNDPETDKDVTAYIFEGPISLFLIEHFGDRPPSVDNIYAVFVAHELGHNLSLHHAYSPADIMFIYGDQPSDAKKKYLTLAANRDLEFKRWQIKKIQLLLEKP